MADLTTYKNLIREIQGLLDSVGERNWAPRLLDWLEELDEIERLPHADVRPHLELTVRSLGGMGSIGDIVISAENGHVVDGGAKAESEVNKRLLNLVDRLFHEAQRLMRQLSDSGMN